MRKNINICALKLLHSFSPSYFPLMILSSFFKTVSPYFNIYLSAEIVNEIVGSRNIDKLETLVLITILGNFIIAVIGALLSRYFGHSEIKLNQNEAIYYNKQTLTLDYSDLEKSEIRQLRRKITESARINCHGRQLLLISINRITNVFMNLLLSSILCIEMIASVVASGYGLVPVIYVLGISILISLNVWYNFRNNKKLAEISNSVSQTMIDENRIDEAVDCYNMGKDVRLYRQDALIMKIKNYALELHKKAFSIMASKRFVIGIPVSTISTILKVATYLFICYYAIVDIFPIGSIIKYVGFADTIIGAIISMFNICADIKYNTRFVEDYLDYFYIPRAMCQGTLSLEKSIFSEDTDKHYEVEFRNVSFKYPDSENFSLKNVSIKFNVGERIAIVGMNGSGKTTFIKLLCRLYDPTEGEIFLNGINIKEYKYEEYMSVFSVVFQDYKLFSFDLAENVASGKEYDAERVKQCLFEAGFERRLLEMPDGINTYLYKDFEQHGVEISGGEAQKIALARALYKDSPFIILDEPTAALDPISEYEIYSRFNNIIRERTAIYISHRLSSCRFCDRIVVFDNGEIIQSGTHNSLLMDEAGKYHELWYAQAQYYSEGQ